jgi:hypothetical protein
MSADLSGYSNGGYIFNPNDFSSATTIDTATMQEIISELDPVYINVNGSDVMNGDLTVNSVTLTNYLQFNDNTLQTTAFNANSLTAIQNSLTTDEADIATLKTKIQQLLMIVEIYGQQ